MFSANVFVIIITDHLFCSIFLFLQLFSDQHVIISFQKNELTVSEAKLLSQGGGGEGVKENGPTETALLQASLSRLNSDVEELKKQCTQKDTEITSLRSQLDNAQADLVQAVS